MISFDYNIPQGKRNVLLVNPPVYDFSDFKLEYCQPTGLLRISSLLKKSGASVELIDCLEDVSRSGLHSAFPRHNSIVERFHFGMSFEHFEKRLVTLSNKPDEVYITSFATYWYESTQDLIERVRCIFPDAKIIVGGIYPTLSPEHALRTLNADVIVVGEIKEAARQFIDFDLYSQPKYLGIKPSRGCPHNCSYCAQKAINGDYMSFTKPERVVDEIEIASEHGLYQIYLFSENFLYNREHFISILKEIIRRDILIRIGAPKGLEPRLLDDEMLSLMKQAGWVGLRLALETISDRQRKRLGRLYNNAKDYEHSLCLISKAGFNKSEVGTFLLYGTPDELLEDVKDSADYIHSCGSYIIPMAFTPVPRSALFEAFSAFLGKKDLTDLHGHLYPFAEYNGYNFEDYLLLESVVKELNQKHAIGQGFAINLDCLESTHSGSFARSELSLAIGS